MIKSLREVCASKLVGNFSTVLITTPNCGGPAANARAAPKKLPAAIYVPSHAINLPHRH